MWDMFLLLCLLATYVWKFVNAERLSLIGVCKIPFRWVFALVGSRVLAAQFRFVIDNSGV